MAKAGLSQWKEKIVGFGSDGAAVMIGRKGGVTALMKEEIPYLVDIHCLAHKLELGALDGLKSNPQLNAVKEMLHGIYKQYHQSPKAWRELRSVAETLEEEVLKPVNIGGTRWLPHLHRALTSVTRSYGPLVAHFEHVVETKSSSAEMVGRARHISRHLKDFKSLQFVFLLLDILEELSRLSLKFQEDSTTLSEANQALEKMYLAMTAMTFEPGPKLATFLEEAKNGIYRGVELSHHQDGNSFDARRKDILDSLQQYLKQRFDTMDTTDVLAAASVFDSRDWPTDKKELSLYGTEQISLLCKRFESVLTLNGCDIQELNHEWMDLKVFVQHQKQRNTTQLCQLLFQDGSLQARFNNIYHLLEIIQVLPMATAVCERGFSTLKRVKNDWRSNLSTGVLNMLLYICIEGPEIAEYEAVHAVERWWSASGSRRRVPV